jgi:hypothetical protein
MEGWVWRGSRPHGKASLGRSAGYAGIQQGPDKKKASNRCAWLDARSAFFLARVPGGKPARADHIFG